MADFIGYSYQIRNEIFINGPIFCGYQKITLILANCSICNDDCDDDDPL